MDPPPNVYLPPPPPPPLQARQGPWARAKGGAGRSGGGRARQGRAPGVGRRRPRVSVPFPEAHRAQMRQDREKMRIFPFALRRREKIAEKFTGKFADSFPARLRAPGADAPRPRLSLSRPRGSVPFCEANGRCTDELG